MSPCWHCERKGETLLQAKVATAGGASRPPSEQPARALLTKARIASEICILAYLTGAEQ